jgi:transposase
MDREIAASVKKSARANAADPGAGHRVGGGERDRRHAAQPARVQERAAFRGLLGLTPREDSTGKTVRRGAITKKGDTYLRRILVQGAISYLAKSDGFGGSHGYGGRERRWNAVCAFLCQSLEQVRGLFRPEPWQTGETAHP